MPLYEYECDSCRHRFEVIQKFSDAPIASCPNCGGPVTKLLSSPAIQFKGSGWYITDYARKGSGSSKAEPSTSPSEGKTPSTTGGDSTPASSTSSTAGSSGSTAGATSSTPSTAAGDK